MRHNDDPPSAIRIWTRNALLTLTGPGWQFSSAAVCLFWNRLTAEGVEEREIIKSKVTISATEMMLTASRRIQNQWLVGQCVGQTWSEHQWLHSHSLVFIIIIIIRGTSFRYVLVLQYVVCSEKSWRLKLSMLAKLNCKSFYAILCHYWQNSMRLFNLIQIICDWSYHYVVGHNHITYSTIGARNWTDISTACLKSFLNKCRKCINVKNKCIVWFVSSNYISCT